METVMCVCLYVSVCCGVLYARVWYTYVHVGVHMVYLWYVCDDACIVLTQD
jgi:hypothetical protein